MDLSQLSDDDFRALADGNLSGMSDAGFGLLLQQQQSAKSPAEKSAQAEAVAREKYSPTVGMSTTDLWRAGVGKNMVDTARGAGQLVGLGSREDFDEVKRRDAPLMDTTAGKVGYATGAMATAAPAMLIPGANSAAGATAIGAVQGLLQPVGTDDSRLENTLLGAGTNLLATTGVNALSRVIQPKPPQGVNALSGRGVELTIGQRLGGVAKRVEDAMTSIPVHGDLIRNAQRRSIGSFNTAVADDALRHIGAKLPKDTFGREAVEYTERAIGDAYEGALKRVGRVQGDSTFGQELAQLQAMVRQSTMPAEVQKQFNNAIRQQVTGKFQGRNTMTAQTFKDVEGELGRLATRYQGDASVDRQLLGDALQEVQASMRRLLERSAGPDVASDIKSANRAWAGFKRMQRASSFLGAEDGLFSPENYLNTVKALDRSKDKGAFARGNALGQGLADDAVRVMGKKVPDSGTPFRTLASKPVEGLVSTALGAPIGFAYSKTGQNLLRAATNPNRPALARLTAEELEMLAPLLGVASGSAVTATR